MMLIILKTFRWNKPVQSQFMLFLDLPMIELYHLIDV